MKIDFLNPEFVEFIPEKLEPGVLYVSLKYDTANHLCACGCGQETVTNLGSPSGWKFTYDEQGVTLSPSIGNFQIPCKSHYFIEGNRIRWT